MTRADATAYDVLEIEPTADLDEIKRAWRRAALKYHPDTNPAPDASSRMREVVAAWELLSDPVQKAALDRRLAAARRPPPRRRRRRRPRPGATVAPGGVRSWSSSSVTIVNGVSTNRSSNIQIRSSPHGQRPSGTGPIYQGDLRIGPHESRRYTGVITGTVIVGLGASGVIVGRIDGDVVVEGGNLQVDGAVMGDVLVRGGSLEINGWVAGNVSSS